MSERRRCDGCDEWFDAAAPWMRKCRRCFAAERDEAERTRLLDAYEEGIRDASEVALRLAREWYDRGVRSARLDPATLRDAIALCHPDRHPAERRERATATTAALLALRE